MLILAIDTSGRSVSAALLQDDQLLLELNSVDEQPENPPQITKIAAGGEDQLPSGYTRKRSKRGAKTSKVFPPGASELLVPMVKSLIEKGGVSFDQINLIALTTGPGMFTGLRVGVVTAKAFAYSTGADLIGVNSLEVIAAQTAEGADCTNKIICPVLNAQRQQFFCGRYKNDSQWKVSEVGTNEIQLRSDWVDALKEDEKIVVTGSGLKPVVKLLDGIQNVSIADQSLWDCRASSVGKYAWQQYESGRRDDFWKLEPVYFRPSAAEERRDEKLATKNTE